MGLRKKTIKLVTKLLSDDKKRKLYSEAEIKYMERQLVMERIQRQRRKEARRREKGFGYDSDPLTSGGNNENFDY